MNAGVLPMGGYPQGTARVRSIRRRENTQGAVLTMATIAEAARHLFLSERRLKELIDQGVIGRADRGSYSLDGVRENYLKHMREVAAGRAQTGELDPAQERARKDKELADKTAIQNDLLRARVVLVDDVLTVLAQQIANLRTRILALPTKLSATAPETIRPALFQSATDEVRQMLTELSEGAVVDRAKTQARKHKL